MALCAHEMAAAFFVNQKKCEARIYSSMTRLGPVKSGPSPEKREKIQRSKTVGLLTQFGGMLKGVPRSGIARKPKPEDDVKLMEERLFLLKQQMLVEKQRRQEIMQRNVGSIWKTGGAGPLRDKKAVDMSVQKVRLDGLSRESSVTLDSENSRASTARKESPPCNSFGGEDLNQLSPSTSNRPRSSVYADGNNAKSVREDSSLQQSPIHQQQAATSTEIQTDGGRAKKWEINVRPPNKRPQSAPRAPTYFEKVMEARRKFGDVEVRAV